ncbi:hypothetical protein Pmani_036395 [Petrolisthes manimaculis]|uniref:Uncharacterized protein n=1 Tax=Petrolisthes manimaculis TaxID=1843537 RepID=A0AAE1NJQ0_9EUCA|nr:hypothetical protein Pmani_036395 [Petrolisthes manimaculis]
MGYFGGEEEAWEILSRCGKERKKKVWEDKRSSVDLSGHCGPGAPPHPGLTDLPDGRGSTIRGEEGFRGESPQPAPLYVIYDEPNNSVGVKRNSFRGE